MDEKENKIIEDGKEKPIKTDKEKPAKTTKKRKFMKTTSKKVKVIGTQTYVNTDTGELQDMEVISIEDRDFNFHKVWISHIIDSLDLIGNKKIKLAFWIIDHLNKENQLTMTYRQISKKSGISTQTVNNTMSALLSSNFLVRINQGVYQVNPDIIFKGTRTGRMNVLYQYKEAEKEQQEEEKKRQAKTAENEENNQNPSDDTLNSDKNWDTEDIPELKDVM